MNSASIYTAFTSGPEETIHLGKLIGAQLKGGETIELVGDVGSGKTTLTKGVLAGLGYGGEVTSPTFTLGRAYPVRNHLTLHHFDFYRLDQHDIVTDEMEELMARPKSIVLVEWPQSGQVHLPERRLRVHLSAGPSEAERKITVEVLHSDLSSLVEKVEHDFSA